MQCSLEGGNTTSRKIPSSTPAWVTLRVVAPVFLTDLDFRRGSHLDDSGTSREVLNTFLELGGVKVGFSEVSDDLDSLLRTVAVQGVVLGGRFKPTS